MAFQADARGHVEEEARRLQGPGGGARGRSRRRPPGGRRAEEHAAPPEVPQGGGARGGRAATAPTDRHVRRGPVRGAAPGLRRRAGQIQEGEEGRPVRGRDSLSTVVGV